MTIRIKTDETGAKLINSSTHMASLLCDMCGASKDNVDLNAAATYYVGKSGANESIMIPCSALDGTCGCVCFYPIANGTPDAQAIAAAKSA